MSVHRDSYTNKAHFAMYKVWEGQAGTLLWDYLNASTLRAKSKLVVQTTPSDGNTIARDCDHVEFEPGIYLGLQDIEALGKGRHGIIAIRHVPYDNNTASRLNRDLQQDEALRKEAGVSTMNCPLFKTRMYQFGFSTDNQATRDAHRRSVLLRFSAIPGPRTSPQEKLIIRARNVMLNGTAHLPWGYEDEIRELMAKNVTE